MTNILFVHKTAELYGSDNVLYELATGLSDWKLHPIVLLPAAGPLFDKLRARNIETHVVALTTINRKSYGIAGMLSVPFRLIWSVSRIVRLLHGRDIRIVYSNTLSVLSGALFAKWRGIPHVWHVHEIVLSPMLARRLFPRLLRLCADKVVCVSTQTAQWVVSEQPCLSSRTTVIWNSCNRRAEIDHVEIVKFRTAVRASRDDLVITLAGRINRMKGQVLLVNAAEILLSRGYRNLRIAMVGDAPPGQEHFLNALCARIEKSVARDIISILDFAGNIWPVWDATDIAVVPSTEPESFGLVAIEAMAAGKPVVASAAGGLLDIVEHEESGYLVPPGDANALASAIARLCDSRELRLMMGNAGRRRQANLFSRAMQVDKVIQCINPLIDG